MPHNHNLPGYQAYLLRFWKEQDWKTETYSWRFSLENPRTGQRQGFASLEALVSFVQATMASAQADQRETAEENGEEL